MQTSLPGLFTVKCEAIKIHVDQIDIVNMNFYQLKCEASLDMEKSQAIPSHRENSEV